MLNLSSYRLLDLARMVGLALLYLLLAKIALSFAAINNVAILWPPSGLALAALLIYGVKQWPGVFFGAFAVAILVGDPVWVSALIAAGNTLEPLAAVWLLSRCGFNLALSTLRDYYLLGFLAVLTSTAVSGVMGPGTLALAGLVDMTDLPASIFRWWMGDMMGALLAVPLLIWWQTPLGWLSRDRAFEAGLLFGLTFLFGGVVFYSWQPEIFGLYAKAFLAFPLLIWAALRFGRHGVSLMVLLVFSQSMWGVIHGVGYFGQDSRQTGLLNFWLYHAVLNAAGMTLAIALRERRDVAHKLGNERAQLRKSEQRERARNLVLEKLATGAPLPEVLETIVRSVESENPAMLCSILLLDDEGKHLLTGAAPTLPDFYNAAIHDTEIGPGRGSCGHAAFTGVRTVVENVQTHPFWADYKELAGQAGLASCWSEPIRSATGKIIGTFAIYHRMVQAPTEIDIALIEYAAHLAGIAIERKRAEEELHLAATVYQAASEAILVTDAHNRIIAVNPAFSRLTGFTAPEVIGQDPNILDSRLNPEPFYQSIGQALATPGHWHGEVSIQRKNGEAFTGGLTMNVLCDEQGAIHRHIALFKDITQKKQAEELIWQQANYDVLTNLPNRRLFRDRLQQEMKQSRRAGLDLALLLIDLDRFKEVNDTLGHDKGDLLLVEATRRIAACVREIDTVARLGGDEFAVVLPNLADTARVQLVAQAIVQSLAEPFQLDQEVANISASIGIALYPSDATDLEALLKNADQAMFEVKNRGRNGFSYFTRAMQEMAQARLLIIRDLRRALAAGEFEVHYQPIADLANGRIVKAEALLRWRHPTRGMVDPIEFITVAEDIGLIREIGDWVFKEAMHQAKRCAARGNGYIAISVNKSPRQFLTGDSHETWLDYLKEVNLPTECIVIEITEGLLLDERSEVTDKLRQFHELGIAVSIDDFGTGYSSLSHLKKFDIDYLKIDRSFVSNLITDPNDRALAEAIIVMAHKLGIQVIAEGVETEAQRDLLAAAGCDYAQGYLYAKPLPADDFEALLATMAK